MTETRMSRFVITPLDLTAFGRLRISGVSHIGRVALVAQQRIPDVFARSLELVIGTEECERVVDRHDREVFADHVGDQAAPQTGADNDMIRQDRAAMCHYPLDASVFNEKRLSGRIGECLQLAAFFRLIDKFSGNRLGPGDNQTRVGIPHTALDHVFFDERKFFLDLSRSDQTHIGSESLAGSHLPLDFLHPGVVARASDLKATDARVVAHLFEEVDGILSCPDRQVIVACRVTEIGCVRR